MHVRTTRLSIKDALNIAIAALIISTLNLTGCAQPTDATVAPVVDTKNTLLKDAYANYFPIGAAVAVNEYGLDSFTSYGDGIMSNFNSIVAENCMKPGVIQPTEGSFTWTYADNLMAYAAAHGMTVRGHVLVWHSQTPAWMFSATGTQAERKAATQAKMKAHIDAVVGRYVNNVYCWDVVNEAISDSSTGSIYRDTSGWFTSYGDASFIQDAFDYANAAAPNAKLFYNDYSVVNAEKRARIVKMINDLGLKSHGLDGVGMQAHWSLSWPSIQEIQSTIDTFHDMGLDVQITELDIDCYNNSASTSVIPYAAVADALAARYAAIFKCFRDNKDKISAVTLWGVGDDHTWLDHMIGSSYKPDVTRKNYPLLFDANKQKKAAFISVRDF